MNQDFTVKGVTYRAGRLDVFHRQGFAAPAPGRWVAGYLSV